MSTATTPMGEEEVGVNPANPVHEADEAELLMMDPEVGRENDESDPLSLSYATRIARYARRGLSGEAYELFAELQGQLPVPSTAAYNAIIYACLRQGDMQRAMRYFEDLGSKGRPNMVTFSTLIYGFGRLRLPGKSQELFDEMISKYHLPPTVQVYTQMISAYGLAGYTDRALMFFVEMLEKNDNMTDKETVMIALNALLRCLLMVDDIATCMALIRDNPIPAAKQAISFYQGKVSKAAPPAGPIFKLFEPESPPAAGAGGAGWTDGGGGAGAGTRFHDNLSMLREDVFSLIHHMELNGYPLDVTTYTTLMLYTMMKRAYRTAANVFVHMRQKNVPATRTVYNLFLKVCDEGRFLDDAMTLFEEMQNGVISPDRFTYNQMLRVCTSCQRFDLAVDVLRRMKAARYNPSPMSYNLLIQSAAKDNQLDYAFDLMAQCLANQIPIRTTTMISIADCATRLKNTSRLSDILFHLNAPVIPPHIRLIVINAILNSYAVLGEVDQMEKLYNEVIVPQYGKRDRISQNTLIKGYARARQIDKAHSVLQAMKDHHMEPDSYTWAPFLVDLEQKNDLPAFRQLWSEVTAAIEPNPAMNFTFCRLLLKNGLMEEVYQFLEDLTKSGKATWNVFQPVFDAVRRSGDAELGRRLFNLYRDAGLNPNITFVRVMHDWLNKQSRALSANNDAAATANTNSEN